MQQQQVASGRKGRLPPVFLAQTSLFFLRFPLFLLAPFGKTPSFGGGNVGARRKNKEQQVLNFAYRPKCSLPCGVFLLRSKTKLSYILSVSKKVCTFAKSLLPKMKASFLK
ncbi:MAG: hypothetical protein SOY99_05770 [Alloprevotella sp.]|nr:hypothetical protein [Bacteroidales bacterium]MDY3943717.1 hypothetical protein [Alloprevotella sp.]